MSKVINGYDFRVLLGGGRITVGLTESEIIEFLNSLRVEYYNSEVIRDLTKEELMHVHYEVKYGWALIHVDAELMNELTINAAEAMYGGTEFEFFGEILETEDTDKHGSVQDSFTNTSSGIPGRGITFRLTQKSYKILGV